MKLLFRDEKYKSETIEILSIKLIYKEIPKIVLT